MINSLFGDGTRSSVRIVNGINNYVTEMSEETHIEDRREYRETRCEGKTETDTTLDVIFHDEEIPTVRGSQFTWKLFFSFEQFKAILVENTLILHCKTRCCYRTTSPSTTITLDAQMTCTP